MAVAFFVMAVLFAGVALPAGAAPVDDEAISRFRRDNLAFYHELRFDLAESCARALLERDGEPERSRLRALSTLVAIHCSLGETAQVARDVAAMLRITPAASLLPPRRYAAPVVQCFYQARDSLAGRGEGGTGRRINTIAVGEFWNHSVLTGREPPFDIDRFAAGLGQLVQYDLSAVTDIDLVDRARLLGLEREIARSKGEEALDDDLRVAAGRLCGAHAFLFGSVMMVDPERIRIGVRLVATATGEVLLADKVDGKVRNGRDVIALERRLVVDLLGPEIDGVVEAYNGKKKSASRAMNDLFDEKELVWGAGKGYLPFLLETGEAIRFEEDGDYTAALEKWKSAAARRPGDERIASRILSLEAWLYGRRVAAGEEPLEDR